MTPKEKAEELINKFTHPVRWKMGQEDIKQRAKQCALIAVDEIIESRSEDTRFDDTLLSTSNYHTPHPMHLSYWKEVKHELNKL